jgi:hypothetical protein
LRSRSGEAAPPLARPDSKREGDSIMRHALCALLALGGTMLLQGCYSAPVVPPIGIVYTDIHAPLDTDANATPVTSKSGEAESMSILGLVATGDASVHAAAAAGGLQKVEHVDYYYFNVLGVIQRFRTVAYGE